MGDGGSDRNRGHVHTIVALSFPCNFVLCKFLLMLIPNQYSQQAFVDKTFLHVVWLCWFDCLILFQRSAQEYFQICNPFQWGCKNKSSIPSMTKSMVAYFCHYLSDNYVDLSDLYVDLSDVMSTC